MDLRHVSRFEFLKGNESNATTSRYGVGPNIGTKTFDHKDPYIPMPVENNNLTSWYPNSRATHNVCKEPSALNNSTLYLGNIRF